MKRVYSFLQLASEAAMFIGPYNNSIKSEENELENPFSTSNPKTFEILTDANSDNIQIPFNDICEELISIYEQTIEEYDCDSYADELLYIIEEQMRSLDEIQRNVLIARIIKRSIYLIIDGDRCIECSQRICENINNYGEDMKEMSKNFEAINFFLATGAILLYKTGDLCQDYGIDIKEICLSIFNGVPNECLYLSIFDTVYGTIDIKNKKRGQSNKKNDFTLFRKKEAIIAMLEELGVKRDGTGAIADSQIKKFIYFLTGSGSIEDDIRNTSVADIFKPCKDVKNSNTINNDLEFVAARFEDIGLFELSKKIKNGKN